MREVKAPSEMCSDDGVLFLGPSLEHRQLALNTPSTGIRGAQSPGSILGVPGHRSDCSWWDLCHHGPALDKGEGKGGKRHLNWS